MMLRRASFFLISTLLSTAPLAAQVRAEHRQDSELVAAEAAMNACAAAAAERRYADAHAGAKAAEDLLRARIDRRPDDVRALVALARTLGQCRVPGAELMRMAELSAEAIELLQRALEVEPEHWQARYILALNYYRAPSFAGRAGDAARELDRLLALQGDRSDVAEFARVYEYRGMLWSRAGARDSAVAVWRRGLALFPADTALNARLGAQPERDTTTRPRADSASAVAAETAAGATRGVVIDTVRIVASRALAAAARPTPSERSVTRSEIVTSAGGTADVLQAVQLQPGATRVGDGADLHARGGDPAESPTFIDGGRILSVARFEGLNGALFGALDPFVVRAARFSSGGFSARHGNALSGMLDVETEGRPRERQWRAGLGLAQTGATLRVPLDARTGAWGTVRATHAAALLRTHGRSGEFAESPYSFEAMGAFVAQPAVGTELRAVTLLVRDASARIVDANGFTGPYHADGATTGLILSGQRLMPHAPVLLRGNVALSERTTDIRFGVLARDRRERSAVARTDAEYGPSDALTMRGGVELGLLARADAGVVPLTSNVAPGSPTRPLDAADSSTTHLGGYAEAEVRAGRLRFLGGVRADRLPGESDVTFDPRLAVSTRFGLWTARASAGLFHQGRWRAESSIPDGGTPSGLPRQASHVVAGVEREGAVVVRAEAFLKDYSDYGEYGAGPPIADGSARGVDLLVQRPAGSRMTGWLGYSYLDAEVHLADGRAARSPYDVTHTATASAMLRVARGTTLGSTVRYGTGRPFTPIVGSQAAGAALLPEYGAPTSERLPDYARWDARLMQFLPVGRTMFTAYLEVLNILDRSNVAGYVWDAEYRSRRATSTFYSQRTLMAGIEIQSR